MKALQILTVGFLILAIGYFTGCSTNSMDETERTFPLAFNLESTTIETLRNEVAPPDSLNINAFVVGIVACPDGATCVLPDGIFLSESLNPASDEQQFFLEVRRPQQFAEDRPYLLSLGILTFPGNGKKRFRLLGYSQLLNVD